MDPAETLILERQAEKPDVTACLEARIVVKSKLAEMIQAHLAANRGKHDPRNSHDARPRDSIPLPWSGTEQGPCPLESLPRRAGGRRPTVVRPTWGGLLDRVPGPREYETLFLAPPRLARPRADGRGAGPSRNMPAGRPNRPPIGTLVARIAASSPNALLAKKPQDLGRPGRLVSSEL